MGFENFPAVLQPAFQQNMLDKRWLLKLGANNVYRKSAYVLPLEKRSGETMIYSRAGRISPVLEDIAPASQTGPLNAGTPAGVGSAYPAFPMEQFAVGIGMLQGQEIDLNLIQDEQIIASLFKENVDNLAEQAALSLDLRAARLGFQAYEGGSTFVDESYAAVGSAANCHVDNVLGFDKAFQQVTINGNVFSTGLPQATSATYTLAVKVTHLTGIVETKNVTGVVYDGTYPTSGNASSMQASGLNTGWSGKLTLASDLADALVVGDTIQAFDAQQVLRPNGKLNRYELAATDTIGAQLIIDAVAQLRRNGIKPPLSNGTYPCYIDPIVDAQFFTDAQYQIMSQGQMESPDFKGARVSQNFGVTFVPTTNAPVYSSADNTNSGLQVAATRRAIVCGTAWLQESPFAGVDDAISNMPDMGVSDIRLVERIAFVTRLPIDRAGQILSQMWWYIGGFVVPTNATINKTVIPSATASRYKSAVVVEVATAD